MTPSLQFDFVLALVSVAFDEPKEKIMSHDRHEKVAFARHTLWYILRELADSWWSLQTLGEQTGGKKPFDHGAVLYGVRRIHGLPPNDRRRARVQKLLEQAKTLGGLPTFQTAMGRAVVIQNTATGQVTEAVIEKLSSIGDGVRLKLNGAKYGKWDSKRNWMILEFADNTADSL